MQHYGLFWVNISNSAPFYLKMANPKGIALFYIKMLSFAPYLLDFTQYSLKLGYNMLILTKIWLIILHFKAK